MKSSEEKTLQVSVKINKDCKRMRTRDVEAVFPHLCLHQGNMGMEKHK